MPEAHATDALVNDEIAKTLGIILSELGCQVLGTCKTCKTDLGILRTKGFGIGDDHFDGTAKYKVSWMGPTSNIKDLTKFIKNNPNSASNPDIYIGFMPDNKGLGILAFF